MIIMEYAIGLSLGQMAETSGLAIGERGKTGGEKVTCHIRHLERFQSGLSYPDIIKRVAELIDKLRGHRVRLTIDATATGKPIVDLFEDAKLPIERIVGVTITGGDAEARDYKWARLPKRVLVSTVQMLLQTERLKFAPAMPDVDTLISDLSGFRLKQSELLADANAMLWRETARDDLVFAVALSSWLAVGFDTWHVWSSGYTEGYY